MIEVKQRWSFLRQSIWTEEFILDMVSDMYEDIKNILEIDTNMWNPLLYKNDWENEMEDLINYLYEWIPKKLNFCDFYFEEL